MTADSNDARCTVITVTHHGRRNWLLDLLDAVKHTTDIDRIRYVVVDNASDDGTTEALRAYPWVQHIRNDTNLDCARGLNQGLREMSGPFAVNLDTDALVFRPGWLEEFENAFRDPDVWLAGNVWNPGFAVPSELYANDWDPVSHGVLRLDHAQGGALAIRRAAIDGMGLMNERYVHNYCDVEYSYRCLSYGKRLAHLPMIVAIPTTREFLDPNVRVAHPVRDTPIRDEVRRSVLAEAHGTVEPGEPLTDERTTLLSGRHRFGDANVERATAGESFELTGENGGVSTRTRREDWWVRVRGRLVSGSLIVKVRAEDDGDEGYHVVLTRGSAYLARANHKLAQAGVDNDDDFDLVLACTGLGVHAFWRGMRLMWAVDRTIDAGSVKIAVNKGQVFIDELEVRACQR